MIKLLPMIVLDQGEVCRRSQAPVINQTETATACQNTPPSPPENWLHHTPLTFNLLDIKMSTGHMNKTQYYYVEFDCTGKSTSNSHISTLVKYVPTPQLLTPLRARTHTCPCVLWSLHTCTAPWHWNSIIFNWSNHHATTDNVRWKEQSRNFPCMHGPLYSPLTLELNLVHSCVHARTSCMG